MDSRRGSHRVTKKKSRISLYSNSENALAWIDQYGENELSGQLQVLKNKVKFRTYKRVISDFYFKQISIEEINDCPMMKYVSHLLLNLLLVSFSIGVHIVENEKTG
jgi:hypothetical protein